MAPGGPSLKQKIQQKLLKPKYTPHTDEEALHLCNTTATRSGSTDIVLDAVSSRASSRPGSTEPRASADSHTYQDITASLLGPDTAAAAAGRSDQGVVPVPKGPARARGAAAAAAFKGCMPFGKPPSPPKPNDGLPTAFNNRQSILSKLSRAARKPALPAEARGKPVTPPKATPAKTKKVAHPLHMAAWRTNAPELQEQLTKPGADANKRDKNSMTALHYAAWQGSIDCVQLLLEHGADINKADAEGMLPIHFASMFNRLDVVAMLLDRGSHMQPPPAKRGRLQVSWPTTPLIVAAKMGHTAMVALLMDRGASVAGTSKSSKTALHEAAFSGHAEVVAELLRKGVDHDLALPKTGLRALHLAALKGSQPVVQALLLGGANVDARAKDGRTPLHVACEQGSMEAAAALIGLGGADLTLRDNSGFTPLHVAVDKNHLALAKTLMDRGAAVDATTNLGALPLTFAHDPDFYKLLRAVRWYSAASCPSGNNPSSSSYWSPPGAMEAAATAAGSVPVEAAAEASEGGAGLPTDYFGPAAAAPDAEFFGGYAKTGADAPAPAAAEPTPGVVRFQAPSPTKVPAGPAAMAGSSKGVFGSRAGKGFPASSWLKNLHLPGKGKGKQAAPLAATMTLAQGGFCPMSAAAGAAPAAQVPLSTCAGDYEAPAGQAQSRSHSRASSISLAGGGRHSPAASEGSSVVARNAAAEIARTAVANVVQRAAREEAELRAAATAAAQGQVDVATGRSGASSPETWSHSAAMGSAASGVATQAALRRLLGFDDETSRDTLGKVGPGDVDARCSLGDQDKWLPGTAATPSSAATFAAFAAEASEQDDVRAAAALAAAAPGDCSPGGMAAAAGPKASAAAAAAAFTAAAAAAAAAAVGGGVQVDADAVKQQGSPSGGGSASKGSGKKGSKAGKVLRPWRT